MDAMLAELTCMVCFAIVMHDLSHVLFLGKMDIVFQTEGLIVASMLLEIRQCQSDYVWYLTQSNLSRPRTSVFTSK